METLLRKIKLHKIFLLMKLFRIRKKQRFAKNLLLHKADFTKRQFFGKDSRHGSEFPVFENFRHHKMWLFYSMFSATFKTN